MFVGLCDAPGECCKRCVGRGIHNSCAGFGAFQPSASYTSIAIAEFQHFFNGLRRPWNGANLPNGRAESLPSETLRRAVYEPDREIADPPIHQSRILFLTYVSVVLAVGVPSRLPFCCLARNAKVPPMA